MPKVIDLPTATTMDSGDYFVMEESTGGTKKITRANSVDKVTTVSNIITRTSGGTVSSSVKIVGKVAFLSMTVTADTTYTAGSNAFAGTINSAYTPPISCLGASYIAAAGIIINVSSNGTVTARVISGTVTANTSFTASVVLLLP